MNSYKNLEGWKKSMQLVKDVYLTIKDFPKEELYGLTSQIKRAAVSIPSNIAEGIGRNYKKDTIQFLHISRGSLYELETLFSIAEMIGVLKVNHLNNISENINECGKILNGLISYYEKSNLK
ncbi:MAG: four helix bundle protein [Ginsengibacter sp.]